MLGMGQQAEGKSALGSSSHSCPLAERWMGADGVVDTEV